MSEKEQLETLWPDEKNLYEFVKKDAETISEEVLLHNNFDFCTRTKNKTKHFFITMAAESRSDVTNN